MNWTFDIAAFRVSFPEFANITNFPDELLQADWNNATCYITPNVYNYGRLSGDCQYFALTLMTAHLAKSALILSNSNYQQVPGLMQQATIGQVSVSLTPPKLQNQWQWWLQTTPYGQQLLALLQVKSVGGFYSGGSPERSAFRGVNGGFC